VCVCVCVCVAMWHRTSLGDKTWSTCFERHAAHLGRRHEMILQIVNRRSTQQENFLLFGEASKTATVNLADPKIVPGAAMPCPLWGASPSTPPQLMLSLPWPCPRCET
jgi:hypothetical protein